jgi:hypothetical protein
VQKQELFIDEEQEKHNGQAPAEEILQTLQKPHTA